MKIKQWLGYNADASQYLLRPGELRILNNLQSRRPGMLISRKGLRKVYGRWDDESIFGMYRRATILGDPSDFLWLQKVRQLRDLTADQILQGVDPYEYVWNVRRVIGTESRIIDAFDLIPSDQGTVHNFCIAEDRHGRLFIFYGHGLRPRLYRPGDIANFALPMGMDGPESAPKVTPSGEGYFIESVDVESGGGTYNSPPDVIIDGGDPSRKARLKTIIAQGAVVGVDVIDGGSGYAEPPELSVDADDVGSGFRARGNVSSAQSELSGFDENDAGVVTGNSPDDEWTYGSNSSTDSNFIMYETVAGSVLATPVVDRVYITTTKQLWFSDYLPVTDASAFEVGDFVRLLKRNPITSTLASTSNWFTVTHIDYEGNRFRCNGASGFSVESEIYTIEIQWESARLRVDTLTGLKAGDIFQLDPDANIIPASLANNSGTTYSSFNAAQLAIADLDTANRVIRFAQKIYPPGLTTASAWQGSAGSGTVGLAKATYDSTRRRFTALVPLATQSGTGEGAKALLEFSPEPLGFGLDDGSDSSIAVRDTGLMKHDNKILGEDDDFEVKRQDYLYDSYWSGSDFDVQNSAENKSYGGLQASGERFVLGFSGSINNRPADVYWPDYSKLSVWFCTGNLSDNPSQWTRSDVAVVTETNAELETSQKYIEFTLRPTKAAKTVEQVSRTNVATSYEDQVEYPDAVAPKIRVRLRDCPDTWDVDGTKCLPTSIKESRGNRLPWYSNASGVPRPIVDLPRVDDGAGNMVIDASAIEVVDPGSGWGAGTVFAFRLYQANAYAQRIDYNTAVSEPYIAGGHGRRSATDRYVEFRLTANSPDDNTPHGPPHTLIQPTRIGITGDNYAVGNTALVRLIKRPLEYTNLYSLPEEYPSTYIGETVTFTAQQIAVLSSQSDGRIADITIYNKGRNYKAKPRILVRGGGTGYGLAVTPIVENGRIVRVRITDPGLGYTAAPELYTTSQSAQLRPNMRPALRGKYRCAYRYADLSETIVKTVTAYRSENSNTLTFSDAEGVEAEMLLESDSLPRNARIISVSGDRVEIAQEITDLPESNQIIWETDTEEVVGSDSADILVKGGTLDTETNHHSPDRAYRLAVQANGNLVLYKRTEEYLKGLKEPIVTYTQSVWSSGTQGNPGAFAAINDSNIFGLWAQDANVNTDDPIWTPGVQNAGTLTIFNSGNLALFSRIISIEVTVRDMTKPIAYSDLSPIADIEAGPNEERSHAAKLNWSFENPSPPDRADRVEFWRTSADQSLVFYRTEAYGIPTDGGIEVVGEDTLNDEELFDAERPYYAAMPVVLPNGALNAYRFGEPRDDLAVAVAFQDRLWMGVSTSGEKVNTLFYSEFDEFESTPDLNELPIQQNQKSTDVLTALVPFGSMLLAMQHTHTFSVTYNTDPAVDVSVQMLTHRGCLHQRAWDIHENVLYAADESGIYSMTRNGEVEDISLPVRDFFVSELVDFSKRETFFLQTDPRTHILRFFCTLVDGSTDTPSMALCFDIQSRQWWTESYPNSITSACTGRPDASRLNTIMLGAVNGNVFEIDQDADHCNDSLSDTFVDIGGAGYREAPEIRVPNCTGAKVYGIVSEGALVDVVIQNAGWNAAGGIGILAENGRPIASHSGSELQGVEYAPIKLDVGPPVAGGVQAVAYANFSVTPTVRRLSTVSKGEDYVRLVSARVAAFEPTYWNEIAAETGASLTTESGHPLRTQPPVVEVGMECIGEFIPLNAFVSRIDRNNVYLVHPDGSPALVLHGDPRTNEPGTPEDWLENGGTEMPVVFRKPARTHIPYRLQTGFMQLINENYAKNGDALIDRSVTLVYTPTQGTKEIEILERFNGQEDMRANAMRRDRGGPGGWVHRQDSASTVLNMDRYASDLGFATGAAKAKFASRSNADMTGTDQHLQVELHGRPSRADRWQRENFWVVDDTTQTPNPVVIHNLVVDGVVEDAE